MSQNTATSKVAWDFKAGHEVDLADVQPFSQIVGGLPWYEPIIERFQTTPRRARITRDTTIEVTMVNSLVKK